MSKRRATDDLFGSDTKRQEPQSADRAVEFALRLRALNMQFAQWVQQQAVQCGDQLWSDGAGDYVRHADKLLRDYADVLKGSGGKQQQQEQQAGGSTPLASNLFGTPAPGAGAPSAARPAGAASAGAGGRKSVTFADTPSFGAAPLFTPQPLQGGAANSANAGHTPAPASGLSAGFSFGASPSAALTPPPSATPPSSWGAAAQHATPQDAPEPAPGGTGAKGSEAPGGGSAGAAPAPSGGFSFGVTPNGGAAPAAGGGFSFGTPASGTVAGGSSDAAPSPAKPAAFTFGASSTPASGPSSSPAGGAASAAAAAEAPPPASPAAGGFTFGVGPVAGAGGSPPSKGPPAFSFGAPPAGTPAAPAFSFASAPAPASGAPGGLFKFPPPTAAAAAGPAAPADTAAAGGSDAAAAAGADGDAEDGPPKYKPELKVDESVWRVFFSSKARLHVRVKKEGGGIDWEPRGVGQLTVRQPKEGTGSDRTYVMFSTDVGKQLVSSALMGNSVVMPFPNNPKKCRMSLMVLQYDLPPAGQQQGGDGAPAAGQPKHTLQVCMISLSTPDKVEELSKVVDQHKPK